MLPGRAWTQGLTSPEGWQAMPPEVVRTTALGRPALGKHGTVQAGGCRQDLLIAGGWNTGQEDLRKPFCLRASTLTPFNPILREGMAQNQFQSLLL